VELSSKSILIVSNESISFFLCQLIFMYSCSMHLYVNFEICHLPPLNSVLKISLTHSQICIPNHPSKYPQMAPLFAPRPSSNVASKSFPLRPLHAPTFSPQNSSQIHHPNHSFRDPQMHPLKFPNVP
jgi:hypothetical protein